MKAIEFSPSNERLAGIAALACAVAVFVGVALDTLDAAAAPRIDGIAVQAAPPAGR